MNEDFLDLIGLLIRAEARFLVVGPHALAAHGVPRATGDLDVWIDRSPTNVERVWAALLEFGAPLSDLSIRPDDFERPDVVIQMGVPPRRVDLLTGLSGIDFATSWDRRMVVRVADLDVPFLGREELILTKRASGRLRDLADLEALGEPGEPRRDHDGKRRPGAS